MSLSICLIFANKKVTLLLASVLLVCASAKIENMLFAQSSSLLVDGGLAQVTAMLSKNQVQVAEPFEYELVASAPPGTKLVFPAVPEQFGNFEVLNHRDIFDIPIDGDLAGRRSWKRLITFESIITGDLIIPSIEIQVTHEKNVGSIFTEPSSIRVLSVLEDRADPTQFRDIVSVVDVPIDEPQKNSWPILYLIVGGLTIGCSVIAVAIVLFRRKRSWLSPQQWALSELESIRKKIASSDAGNDERLFEITATLRRFLEMQIAVSAPTQTSEEVMAAVAERQILDRALLGRFQNLFARADLAKFAGQAVNTKELRESLDNAFAAVNETANREVALKNSTSVASEVAFGEEV